MRDSGIGLIGKVPWGTHFCQFYQSRDDLVDILVPYFRSGLEENELCMWVTSDPLNVDEARAALASRVPDLDAFEDRGQIEILDYSRWYTPSGSFDADLVLAGWARKEVEAMERGFAGLRLTGNTFWLEKRDWKAFSDYEAAIDGVIGDRRMLALCTYSTERCGAFEVIDVVSNHRFALIKQSGNWAIIESQHHRKTEEALRESEERYRSLVELSPVAIAVHRDGRYLYVNPAGARLFDAASPEDLVGRSVLDLVHPDDREAVSGRIRRIVEEGGTTEGREVRIFRLDGRPVHVVASGNGISFGGRPAVQIVLQDNTERKRAEEELRRAKAAAEEASRAKDAFLAMLSHELRTPLTPALMAASLLEMREDLPVDVREDAAAIRRNVELEARLIEDLLDLTRIVRGKIHLKLEPLDLHAVLAQAIEICRSEIAGKGLHLVVTLDARAPRVMGDPARLQQVFWNLLKNAAKFTPEGGTISVRSSGGAGRRAVVEVADTGMGIEAEALPRIFEAFEQASAGIARTHGGLGLGLAISRALVDLHGGRIAAASEGKGKGSTFRVELGTIHDAPAAPGADPGPP
jgi:PAS domain S-box-containing protein